MTDQARASRMARFTAETTALSEAMMVLASMPDAPQHALAHCALDVGGGQGAAALGQRMFAVVQHPDVDAVLAQDAQQGGDRTVAGAGTADLLVPSTFRAAVSVIAPSSPDSVLTEPSA